MPKIDIKTMFPNSGRAVLEDNSQVNFADLFKLCFDGVRALVVQPYSEANVKRGLQFYTRIAYPTADPIAGGTTRKIYFKLGAKPILVKLREFEYIGEELQIQIFANPTGVTGGTPRTPANWNRQDPQPTTVQILKDVTTTDDGTPLDDEPEYFFGSQSQPNRDLNSIPQGRERVIPAGGEFIVAITNNNGQNARCQYFLDWYEGDTDL